MRDGCFVLCVRDVVGGEDDFIGPYYSWDAAEIDRDRLLKMFAAYGFEDNQIDAIIEPMTPRRDFARYFADQKRELEDFLKAPPVNDRPPRGVAT